jgi:NAD(P)-dependent dehydrogenase (short-subunit alcohol dehydrogenase family)
MTNGLLEGKVVIVTGSGRGMGRTIAKAYAAEGAKVTITARTADAVNTVAKDIVDAGGEAIALPCDVTNPEAVQSMVDKTVAVCGGLDIWRVTQSKKRV